MVASQQRLTRILLLIALLARLFVGFLATRGTFLVGEGRMQAALATRLMEGEGFSIPGEMLYPDVPPERSNPMLERTFRFYREVDGFYGVLRPERPTTFLVPGYAVFLCGVYSLFGAGSHLAVRLVQLLLGMITVALGLALARRFLARRTYAIAGLFIALDPFELYYEAIPATQALFSLLFVGGILLSLRLIERPGWKAGLAAGLVWAAAFYVRPAALPVFLWTVPVALAAGRLSKRSIAGSILAVGVFFAAMVPWMARNRRVSGRAILLPTQGGVNFWEAVGRPLTDHFRGETRGAMTLYGPTRDYWMNRVESRELAEFPAFRQETEWYRDSVLFSRMRRFVARNPLYYVHTMILRFAEFFKPFPLNAFSPLYILAGLAAFFWVLIFMGAGSLLAAARHGPGGFYLATSVWGYVLMHLITISGTPHRVAVDYPLIVLAALGLAHAWRRLRTGRGGDRTA